jgi:hypothetical protein
MSKQLKVGIGLLACAFVLRFTSLRLGVPITYMSINDFLNIVMQMRTVPEVLEYLNARRELPSACLHVVGDELPLYELYIMNGGTLS